MIKFDSYSKDSRFFVDMFTDMPEEIVKREQGVLSG